MPDHRQKPGEFPSKDENHLLQDRGWQQAGGQICCFDGSMQNQCEINSNGHPILKPDEKFKSIKAYRCLT